MTPDQFRAKWVTEAETLRRRGTVVSGAALCEEILRDFDQMMGAHLDASLNLVQAAAESGYSADYLGRMVRDGRIPNAGRAKAPRIRRRDLPRKASTLRPPGRSLTLKPAAPGQIARAVVTSYRGDQR